MSFPDASNLSGGWLDKEILALLSRSEALYDHSVATGPLIKMKTESAASLSSQRALKAEKKCEPNPNVQALRVSNLRSARVKHTRVKPVRPNLPRRRPKAEILRLQDELEALSTHLAMLQQVRMQQLYLNAAQLTRISSVSKSTNRQQQRECAETEHNRLRQAKKINQKLKRRIAEQHTLIQELESVLRDMVALQLPLNVVLNVGVPRFQTPPCYSDSDFEDLRAAQ